MNAFFLACVAVAMTNYRWTAWCLLCQIRNVLDDTKRNRHKSHKWLPDITGRLVLPAPSLSLGWPLSFFLSSSILHDHLMMRAEAWPKCTLWGLTEAETKPAPLPSPRLRPILSGLQDPWRDLSLTFFEFRKQALMTAQQCLTCLCAFTEGHILFLCMSKRICFLVRTCNIVSGVRRKSFVNPVAILLLPPPFVGGCHEVDFVGHCARRVPHFKKFAAWLLRGCVGTEIKS